MGELLRGMPAVPRNAASRTAPIPRSGRICI
nr:MAG TPA: hypothetical protein [Caudoviricetes sp.]